MLKAQYQIQLGINHQALPNLQVGHNFMDASTRAKHAITEMMMEELINRVPVLQNNQERDGEVVATFTGEVFIIDRDKMANINALLNMLLMNSPPVCKPTILQVMKELLTD